MAISPLLIRHNEYFARRFDPGYDAGLEQNENLITEASQALDGHVILCGFGRTSQNLSQFLRRVGIPYIALEVDTDIVNEAREAGEPVFLGDSSKSRILASAGIDRARVVVISFTEFKVSKHIVTLAREMAPDISLLVRTRDDRHLERLLESGADEVIPDTVESSMMLARHTLVVLGENLPTIQGMMEEARAGNYARVRAFFHSFDDIGFDDIDAEQANRHYLRSVEVLSSYHAVGRRIDSLRNFTRVQVIALRRNGVNSEGPLPDTQILAGDVLVIKGDPDDIQAAEIEIMAGL
jgi:CPA2 family monovalent cation:H+ antiporter-2